jgi:hypothetical protein
LRAYGDQHTSHLGKSSKIRNLKNPERSRFASGFQRDHHNLESVKSETMLSERNTNSNIIKSGFENHPSEYQTRERNGAMFYSDIENQPLPNKNKNSVI